jgi:transglutaminase/protease-like cytokinesis protein 3
MVSGIGNGGPHGWNYTNIDVNWYGVDVKWDDQESGKITKFFLASKSVMAEDHTQRNSSPYVNISMDSFQVELPELSTEADYYNNN